MSQLADERASSQHANGSPSGVNGAAETILRLDSITKEFPGVRALAGEYRAWLDQCLDIAPSEQHDAVFGANAVAFYRLDAAASGLS